MLALFAFSAYAFDYSPHQLLYGDGDGFWVCAGLTLIPLGFVAFVVFVIKFMGRSGP